MSERRYLPGVVWLPDHVRRALRYGKQMEQIAATPVDLEDEASSEAAVPHLPTKTAPEMIGQVFPPVSDGTPPPHMLQTNLTVAAYHVAAVQTGTNYPCRTKNCDHHAPNPGDRCPVCADKQKGGDLFGPGDAA